MIFEKLYGNKREILEHLMKWIQEGMDPKKIAEKFSAYASGDVCKEICLNELQKINFLIANYDLCSDERLRCTAIIPNEDNIRCYFEWERDEVRKLENNSSFMLNVGGNINATNSNMILGNITNSTLSIKNSIKQIEDYIQEKGGEEKQELKELLADVKKIIEYVQSSYCIPRNQGIYDRLSNHFAKHGWFYGAIINLLGQTILPIIN